MGNNRSRVAPTRTNDYKTRARYKNQLELIEYHRKLRNINIKHEQELSRLAIDRRDVRMKLHQLQHESRQRELLKRLDQNNEDNNTSLINRSDRSDDSNVSTFESSSLLMHNLNASNEWEKSLIFPNNRFGRSNKTRSFKTFDNLRGRYSSRLDTSHNSFTETESFLSSDNSFLKQHPKQMKNPNKTAVIKPARDSKMVIRRY